MTHPNTGSTRINNSQAMPLDGLLFLGTTPNATTFSARSIRYTAAAIHGPMAQSLVSARLRVLTQRA